MLSSSLHLQPGGPAVRPQARESRGGPSAPANAPKLLVTCMDCGLLHPSGRPLEFSPICDRCAARRRVMQSLGMAGPFPLDREGVEEECLGPKAPGNYALGYMDGDGFVVFYVGRSDSDLRNELWDHVDLPSGIGRWAGSRRAAWDSRPGKLMPLSRPRLGGVGSGPPSSYTHFAYCYAPSAADAFERECRNYRDFGGCRELDNAAAPIQTPSD
jgi:hypothetical protein